MPRKSSRKTQRGGFNMNTLNRVNQALQESQAISQLAAAGGLPRVAGIANALGYGKQRGRGQQGGFSFGGLMQGLSSPFLGAAVGGLGGLSAGLGNMGNLGFGAQRGGFNFGLGANLGFGAQRGRGGSVDPKSNVVMQL